MTDEQRRAMFARLRHGGGSGGGGNTPGESSSTNSPIIGTSSLQEFQSLETSGSTDPDRLDLPQTLDSLFGDSVGGGANIDPAFLSAAGAIEHYGMYETPKSNTGAALETAMWLGPGGLGRIPAIARAIAALGPAGKVISSWKTPVAAGGTAYGIGKYRDTHPTMDPELEKVLAEAQQISSYVSAITGIGAGKGMVAKVAPNTIARSSAILKDIGEAASLSGKALTENIPPGLRDALAKLHGGYTKLADITGASWSDLKNIPQIKNLLDRAASLREAAAAARTQADEIVSAANDLKIEEQNKATDILYASHKGSLVDWESAQRMYGEGAAKWYAAEYGQAASMRTARLMREQAEKMEEQAVAVTQNAYNASIKAALVVAGFTTKEITEEARIRDLQQQMETAFAGGDSFTLPAEEPRGPLGTTMAALIGTLGNPIEKQTRYGMDSYAAQVANYRAKYDAIGRAEQSGELTSAEAESLRADLATKEKPWNMAGKGPWTFAPASAAFVSWQAQQVADYFNHEVEVGRVTRVLDGDTIEVAGRTIRLLGVDTPESVHPTKPPEYLGPEASHFQKENLTGKNVRLVQSPGVDTDKYGRTLRYVETLPGTLGDAFNLPGIGKWIPGADENKRLIDLGYGQPRYLELSGGHERKKDYDAATERAKRAGAGVWSPEGLDQLDYHYTPRGNVTPNLPLSDIGNLLGSGLMLTGQSGALKEMGPAGNAIAQAWNAALAGIGASEFNAKAAARTNNIVFRPPKKLKTDYEQHAESVLKKRQ